MLKDGSVISVKRVVAAEVLNLFFVPQVVRDILLIGHRQAFAWVDEWYGKCSPHLARFKGLMQSPLQLTADFHLLSWTIRSWQKLFMREMEPCSVSLECTELVYSRFCVTSRQQAAHRATLTSHTSQHIYISPLTLHYRQVAIKLLLKTALTRSHFRTADSSGLLSNTISAF